MRSIGPSITLGLLLCLPSGPSAAASGSSALVTQGSLLVSREAKVIQVPLKHTEVQIRVSGPLAEATVRQTFANPYPDKIEAIYAFPLPTDAAVWGFTLRNGDRTITGQVLERARAKAVYERATAAGHVAALLTEERPNLFTQHVANLEPKKTVEVTITYVSRLRYDAGTYELVFPLVVGPRFVPQKRGPAGSMTLLSPPVLPPDVRSSHDIALRVELEAGVSIDALRSPSHRLDVKRLSPAAAVVQIAAGDRMPNRDFILRYNVAGPEPRAALLTHRATPAEPGAFVLIVHPPVARPAQDPATPRELIFVLDASSSMTGAPLASAKRLVRRFLDGLRPEDTFQIVRFADRASSLGPGMIAGRPRNLELARAWLDRLRPAGGTVMTDGLSTALALPHEPARLRLVVLLTDGYIGNEDEVLRRAREQIGPARIFALGVGSAVNRYLLEELATLGRGTVQVLRPDEPVEPAVQAFYDRLSTPVLTDLSLSFRGIEVSSLSPARLPDLFAGEPLLLFGRFTGVGAGTVILTGRRGTEPVAFELPLALPRRDDRHRTVTLAWARARIAELGRDLLHREDEAIKRQILDLALEHHLLTRYTSFVAVDEEALTGADRAVRVRVPVDRPQFLMQGIGYAVHGLALGGGGVSAGSGSGTSDGTIGLGVMGVVGRGGGGGHGAGYGRAAESHITRSPSAPRIVVAAATIVSGSLDKEIIRRVVRRHLNEVRACYEMELGTHPQLAGRVEVELVISPTGQVASAEIRATSLKNPDVERCMATAMRRWSFPGVHDDTVVIVRYPFVFKPAQAPRPSVLHER